MLILMMIMMMKKMTILKNFCTLSK